jgi:lipopolysaccharide heptosyltransferase II
LKLSNDVASPPASENILVIRLSSLGDILLTAPALRALRARFPNSHVDLLVASDYAEAARLIPGPNRVLEFDRRKGLRELLKWRHDLSRRYTIVVDLQNSLRSAFLRRLIFPTFWVRAKRYRLARWLLIRFKWNTYRRLLPVPLRYLDALDMFGAQEDGMGLNLAVPDAAQGWSRRIAEGRKYVVLCPGARHFTKRWPAEKWMQTGCLLHDRGCVVFIVGAAEEANAITEIVRGIPSAIPVIQESISQLAALFQTAQVVVSNDSGLMHLAAGVGAPVVAIFGPTVEEFGFYPFRARSQIVNRDLPCRPCSAMGTERCPLDHFRCMQDIPVTDVLQAVERLWSHS